MVSKASTKHAISNTQPFLADFFKLFKHFFNQTKSFKILFNVGKILKYQKNLWISVVLQWVAKQAQSGIIQVKLQACNLTNNPNHSYANCFNWRLLFEFKSNISAHYLAEHHSLKAALDCSYNMPLHAWPQWRQIKTYLHLRKKPGRYNLIQRVFWPAGGGLGVSSGLNLPNFYSKGSSA